MIGRPAILPNNRGVDRIAGLPIPKQRGFALVGNPYRMNLRSRNPGLGDDLASGFKLSPPNLTRIVLYPPRLGIALLNLFLRDPGDPAVSIEKNRPRGGSALIQRKNVSAQRNRYYTPSKPGRVRIIMPDGKSSSARIP